LLRNVAYFNQVKGYDFQTTWTILYW
jgi:hypothetical protein